MLNRKFVPSTEAAFPENPSKSYLSEINPKRTGQSLTVATVTGIIIDVSTLESWQADVAQLVEQPLRKWSVRGSSPLIGFFYCLRLPQSALEAL